ncbi:MAG: cell wall hydrolase [Clostridia bacterium]|nr:cell wall hydrolase [Clostridia bacterium]
MKKFTAILLVALSLFLMLPLTAAASSSVSVSIDGVPFSGSVQVKNNTTYVGIRKFSTDMDPSASVTYSSDTRTLTVRTSALTMSCTDGNSYIVANGRYLYYDQPIYMNGGTMYAPILQLYRAFDAGIKWSDSAHGFTVTRGSGGITAGSSHYRSDEVYWLSRIISAEAKGESLRGKIAVGNVILNRVRSSAFPNTIYGVIFDKKYGVQFTPASNGTIYGTPTEESIIAAKICLEGYTVSSGILYFVNPTKSPNSWASKNRAYFGKIGNHAFYY